VPSNTVTDKQVEKLSRLVQAIIDGVVALVLDREPEGENGARRALVEIAQHCAVRLAWSSGMRGGALNGRQPESLRRKE
jgi:hypothetical protein